VVEVFRAGKIPTTAQDMKCQIAEKQGQDVKRLQLVIMPRVYVLDDDTTMESVRLRASDTLTLLEWIVPGDIGGSRPNQLAPSPADTSVPDHRRSSGKGFGKRRQELQRSGLRPIR